FPGFIGPTGVIQLLGSVFTASSVWLIGVTSGFPSTSLVLCRVPSSTSSPWKHFRHRTSQSLIFCHGLLGLWLYLDHPPLQLLPSSGFPIVLDRSLITPVSEIPSSTSVTRASRFTLGFPAFRQNATLVPPTAGSTMVFVFFAAS
ncbi:hypothetical protein M9458_021389, partial [Cirrhinus mrigala]